MIKELNPPADVKQLHPEVRRLMTETTQAQERLSKASQVVLAIETKLTEISAVAATAEARVQSATFEFDQKRQTLLARQSLGTDVAKELQAIDHETTELSSQRLKIRELTQTRVGLQRELALANIALSEDSKNERKARLALVTLLEEQKAAAYELAISQCVDLAVAIEALAQLRNSQGIDGLQMGELVFPKASLSEAKLVRLAAGEYRGRVNEQVRRITATMEKRGIQVSADAIARLQSPSTRQYEVIEPLQRNGVLYQPGASIMLPDVEARSLLASRTIAEPSQELLAEISTPEAEPQAA